MKLSDAEVDELFALVKANPGIHFDVDLEAQEVKAGEKTYRFTIDAFRRHCMMNGLDSIGLTLQHDDAIAAYEAEHGQAVSGDDYVVRNIRRIRHEAK